MFLTFAVLGFVAMAVLTQQKPLQKQKVTAEQTAVTPEPTVSENEDAIPTPSWFRLTTVKKSSSSASLPKKNSKTH